MLKGFNRKIACIDNNITKSRSRTMYYRVYGGLGLNPEVVNIIIVYSLRKLSTTFEQYIFLVHRHYVEVSMFVAYSLQD